jgi:ABC-type nitrate/sulfonate/bicarbonate transport system substrate-binding protein
MALASTIIVCFAAASRPAAAQPYRISQVSVRVLYLAPIFAAMEQGFFKQHQVDFTFRDISNGTLATAAILSGDAQVSNYDIRAMADLKAQGKSLVLFYNLVTRVTLDLVVRNDAVKKGGVDLAAPPLERVKQLGNITYGITGPGAPSDVFARYFLKRAGIDPERDATIVQVGSPGALAAALRSGRIDGFFLSPPLSQTLESEGVAKTVIHNTAGELPELSDTSYSALFTSESFAKANPAALKAYAAAVRDGVKWVNDHRDETVKLLHEKWFPNTKPETLRAALDALLPSISPTGQLSRTALERFLAIFETIGDSTKVDLTEGDLWTNEFVR